MATSALKISGKTFLLIALLVALAGAAAAQPFYLPIPGNPPPDAKPDRRFLLVARENDVVIDEGVVFRAFTFNGTVPGPLMVVREGDVVEIVVRNEGKYTHGLSIHAANTQTSKFVANIPPGREGRLLFKADFPGVYMYHCAPGGHGIFIHTMAGMYGMFVVEPRQKYRLEEQLGRGPDVRVYIMQHEIYSDGRAFYEGVPTYVVYNGEVFRYVKEPIKARPGDYVRFYWLNIGPSLTASFHAVGGIWEYAYYGGNPANVMAGLQNVVAAPTDSWVIEWRVPAEGNFLLVTHALGTQTMKGAVGILSAKADGERTALVDPQGRRLPLPPAPKRVIAPFEPAGEDPRVYQPLEPVTIQIVGNTFWPKVARVPVGTSVTWVNEDVLALGSGEVTGEHTVVAVQGPAAFQSRPLKNGEKFTYTFDREGEYSYICGIHPYMKGTIIVYRPGQPSPLQDIWVPLAVILGILGVALGAGGLVAWRRVRKS